MDETAEQKHIYWMTKALELAEFAEQQNEIPVGAIVVCDNEIMGRGWNQSIQLHDPSAHAEMIAIREAGKTLSNYRMIDCTLYVTLEPCPMCAGLLVHSRIKEVVFGASDQKTGAVGSVMNLLHHDKSNHQPSVIGGVMAQECGDKLSAFFKRRRLEKKQMKAKINTL